MKDITSEKKEKQLDKEKSNTEYNNSNRVIEEDITNKKFSLYVNNIQTKLKNQNNFENLSKDRIVTESTPTRRNNAKEGTSRKSPREKISSAWVTKVASGTETFKIDIYDVLTQYDYDNDGCLSPFELRTALIKMKLKLTEEDIENMFAYFEISNVNLIKIKEFSKNFMNKILKKPNNIN